MADYTNTKEGLGRVLNENAVAVPWEDLGPLIAPEELVQDHLFGIPLVSAVRNPNTGKFDEMTPDALKRIITRAVSLCELEGKFDIMPRQYREKQAWDRAQYQSWGFLTVRHLPVESVEDFTVTTSSEEVVYRVPPGWIDVIALRQGQINILPLTISMRDNQIVPLAGPGASAMLLLFSNYPWVASFWEVLYTTGFKDGKIPRIINEYIGVVAAMEVLSMLAATYAKSTSTSLSMDGLGQSISGPGPEIFNTRLEQLASKRHWLKTRLQSLLGLGLVISNV